MDYTANAVSNDDKALEKDIDLITKSLSRPYFNNALKKLARENPTNAQLICDYILNEQTEFNIKESSKEGKIKMNFPSGNCIHMR